MVSQPVLIVHGMKDERINISYGQKNFDNLASGDKEFYKCKEAHHLDIRMLCGIEYDQKGVSVFKQA